jgi:hypothetical protein
MAKVPQQQSVGAVISGERRLDAWRQNHERKQK